MSRSKVPRGASRRRTVSASTKATETRAPEVSVSTTPPLRRSTDFTSPAARQAARAACADANSRRSAASLGRRRARLVRRHSFMACSGYPSACVGGVSRRGRGRGRLLFGGVRVLGASVGVRVRLLAELLYLLEELAALFFGRQPVALALLQLPLRALDELDLARHVVAEAGRGAARVKAGAQEDAVLDHVAEALGAAVARDGLVQAALVVRAPPVLHALLDGLLAHLDELRPVPAHDDDARDDRHDDQQDYQAADDEQHFQPSRHCANPSALYFGREKLTGMDRMHRIYGFKD